MISYVTSIANLSLSTLIAFISNIIEDHIKPPVFQPL